jgi:hypothetical protein
MEVEVLPAQAEYLANAQPGQRMQDLRGSSAALPF